MEKRNKIIYWVATVLLAIGMLQSGIFAVLRTKQWVDLITPLGYPVYFLTILGAWKILGVIAILIPRFKLLKEWAYAGLFFDLTGAAYSGFKVNPDPKEALFIIFYAFLFASYFLYHKRMKMMAQHQQ